MLESLFPNIKPVVGMIHVGALPGAPANRLGVGELTERAVEEARLYVAGGVDGIMIENMHDAPYCRGTVGPEVVAAMAVVARAVKVESKLPTGVQVLAAANLEALAVAHAAELDFVRAEGYAFAHVADEGLIEACAAELLRYRRMIGAERVQVWADVKKKHSAHAITADVSLGEMAAAVEFMRGDAVIVTGSVTGEPPRAEDLRQAKAHTQLPVLLGSGASATNMEEFYAEADGFIVGTSFKAEGDWTKTVELSRVESFMEKVRELRSLSTSDDRRDVRA
ncbi:MAG TPA: BtpA/SgcQ family protein [Pyrinomonadaceae bacterium]|nr:BtpA/SgcQ family protein [Pyrinomonadaceae bacterium]